MGRETKQPTEQEMLAAASGLMGSNPVNPVNQSAGNQQNQPAQPVQQNQPVQQGQPVQPVQPIVVDTPLGQQVYGATPLDQVKLASFADVAAFAKNHAGVELKDVQDFVKVFDSYKQLQEVAKEVPTLQKNVKTYESAFNNLPEDVAVLVKAVSQGEDYTKYLQKLSQKATFDFDKPVEKHDDVALINFYTGKNYTDETLNALPPEAQDALHIAAKTKYEVDRKEFLDMKNRIKSSTEQRQKSFLTSIDQSIAQLQTNNPSVGKAVVERVREIMTYGFGNVLFDSNKSYLPDAAEKIAYMEFGKVTVGNQAKTINEMLKMAMNKGESNATEKIMLRGDKPAPTGGGGTGLSNELQAAVEAATSFLKPKR